MRYTPLLLLLPLIAACEDALGPAGGCQRQMRDYREDHGTEDTSTSGRDGDIFWETWFYAPRDGKPGQTVTFQWGTGMSCQVTPRAANALFPAHGLINR